MMSFAESRTSGTERKRFKLNILGISAFYHDSALVANRLYHRNGRT
jgi:hypothetical protein